MQTKENLSQTVKDVKVEISPKSAIDFWKRVFLTRK